MPLLEVKSLHVYYGDFQILDDVSIYVNDYEIVSIVGANSAGKSTLLNAISGIAAIKSGDILFRSKRIGYLKPHEIARLGLILVPEGRRIFPIMTVLENLLVGSVREEARQRRQETLDYVFSLFPVLKERKNQLGGTLSGGEQQMLAIARGLMALPSLLMLDEPSVGLAPIMVETIFNVISEISRGKIPILLVEQNVQRSLSIASRGYILERGKIRMEGIGQEVLANPYVKETYLGL
ncbi:MAG: branched-chain amino acid ABC transporter ATP-binding protein [Deltaproteobacteria bacterium]|nr:MAG: branched-chain amino acid ABC transporter ATP-binding protein [Deltaproteobacteria bacterium]